MTMLAQHVAKLYEELNIDKKVDPEKEVYPLAVNDSIIHMQEMEDGFFYRGNILSCPSDHLEEVFIYVMRANLLGQGTGSAVIGIDEQEKYLTLSLHLPYEQNYRAFKEGLEDFINYLMYWREEIEELLKKTREKLL